MVATRWREIGRLLSASRASSAQLFWPRTGTRWPSVVISGRPSRRTVVVMVGSSASSGRGRRSPEARPTAHTRRHTRPCDGTSMDEDAALLHRVADEATSYLGSVGTRPVGLPASTASNDRPLADRLPQRLPDGPLGRVGGPRRAAGHRRRRAGGHRIPPLLRLRDRLGPAGRHRRRLADLDLGPERRPVHHRPGRGGHRGDRRRVAARPPRPALDGLVRRRHRLPDGPRHPPRRGPPPRAGPPGLGRRARRAGRRALRAGARPAP